PRPRLPAVPGVAPRLRPGRLQLRGEPPPRHLGHQHPPLPRGRLHLAPAPRPELRGGRLGLMSAISTTSPVPEVRRPAFDPGRPFLHAAFDYLVIGGGLSIVVLGALQSGAIPSLNQVLERNMWAIVFFANSAHFAASTVRLYTKPGALKDFRFL